MDHYQYLILMAACLVATLPLEALGARVCRQPARLARAVLPVALVFLIWDGLAIAGHVWTYNPRYVTGASLPFRHPRRRAGVLPGHPGLRHPHLPGRPGRRPAVSAGARPPAVRTRP